jgi:hypothetical protein
MVRFGRPARGEPTMQGLDFRKQRFQLVLPPLQMPCADADLVNQQPDAAAASGHSSPRGAPLGLGQTAAYHLSKIAAVVAQNAAQPFKNHRQQVFDSPAFSGIVRPKAEGVVDAQLALLHALKQSCHPCEYEITRQDACPQAAACG